MSHVGSHRVPGTRTLRIEADTRPHTKNKNGADDGRDDDDNDNEDFDDDADRADPNDDGARDPDVEPERGRRG